MNDILYRCICIIFIRETCTYLIDITNGDNHVGTYLKKSSKQERNCRDTSLLDVGK